MFEDQIEFKNRTDKKTQNTERRNACQLKELIENADFYKSVLNKIISQLLNDIFFGTKITNEDHGHLEGTVGTSYSKNICLKEKVN